MTNVLVSYERDADVDRFLDASHTDQVLAQLNDSDFETEAELPPLESFISKDILRKLSHKEKKWQEIVNGRHCLIVVVTNTNSSSAYQVVHR